jgi:5-methylcytosine-specific restriction enzyme subunit McrC
MPTITLFEHQRRSYAELGWETYHPAVELLEGLNQASGVELIRLGHKHLQARQFVGVIRVGETTLQILPKIDFEGNSDDQADSKPYQAAIHSATWNLLYLLSYTQNLQIKEQDVAPLLSRRSDWFELLTRLLAMDLHRLMKRGPEHAYVIVEETLPVMRGRWQLERQLTRRPYVRHLFDVIYDEFSPDTPLNQVFWFVVGRLLLRTQDPGNRRLLLDLRERLSGVQRLSEISQAHLEGVHFTRLNERFRPAFNLARLFIENSAFQLSAGQHRTFAFVFDMDRLFEEFVYRFIARRRKHILPEEWADVCIRAQSQGEIIYLAERLPDRQQVFRLIPDLLFTKPSGKPMLILDTKYKQLDTSQRRLGISEGDMYQMLAYATRLDCPRLLLLYPQWAGSQKAPIEFEMLGHPNLLIAATINLRQPLNRPDGLIQELRDILKEVPRYGSIT